MRPNRRELMLGAMAAGLCSRSAAASEVTREGGAAFGSTWRVVHGAGGRVAPLVEAIVAQVDGAMSPYSAASDLSVFNRREPGDWYPVSPALADVAAEALQMAAVTGGAFDPTVGPVVSRLGFGPINGRVGPVGGIERRGAALRKTVPGLTLDLCGIAKGHALDLIVETLRDTGIKSALVELGGEVRGIGRHPDGRAWRVAIADPTSPGRAWRAVTPGPLALATSGHAAQGVTGRIGASHIVNPRTHRAADTGLMSVSVLAPTAMRADALATALAAAGPVGGIALARRLGVSALFVTDDPGGPVETLTSAFADHLTG